MNIKQIGWKEVQAKILKVSIGKRILIYIIAIIVSITSLLQVQMVFLPNVLGVVLYCLAGAFLAAGVFYMVRDVLYLKKHKIRPTIEKNHFANRLSKDYYYRTVMTTYSSFTFNVFFAMLNGIYGVIFRSWWFVTLAVYYIILSVMRLIAIRMEVRDKKEKETRQIRNNEWNVYRKCGILFVLLTIAMIGAVFLMVFESNGKSYPGIMIFVVALYTFYRIILSIINLLKAKRLKFPLIMTIRNIGYADAMVSILFLQTAMFKSFNKEHSSLPRIMNAITGGVVCVTILFMGIRMIILAGRRLSKFDIE